MAGWTCPGCGRRFGRKRQSHECAPGQSLDSYLADQPEERRSTYRAFLELLGKLGEIDIDPVPVGILVKRARTFCELRPRRGCVALSFKLSRPLADRRVRKSLQTSANRMAHFVDLTAPEDVDDQISEWLAEAFLDSPI